MAKAECARQCPPESLSSHAAWAAFHQNLCAPPATPIQPDPPQPTRAAPPVDGLEAAITQAEVEKALPKLSNCKATGCAGWPAAPCGLPCHLGQWAQGQSLDACSHSRQLSQRLLQGGRLPACVSSALVTPIHKKGPAGDPANYRPIAVGEPLYRLITIILNDRLVAWSEEHGLRSPVQAGFRPRQSPIHHLFALRHFIDRAILQLVRVSCWSAEGL